MPNPNITFDHVHLISKHPKATAQWYVDKLGGDIVRDVAVKGAPQLYVEIGGGAMLIVRGERPGESTADKNNLEWGVDHFGVRVKGDFMAFCDGLKSKGVAFIAWRLVDQCLNCEPAMLDRLRSQRKFSLK